MSQGRFVCSSNKQAKYAFLLNIFAYNVVLPTIFNTNVDVTKTNIYLFNDVCNFVCDKCCLERKKKQMVEN